MEASWYFSAPWDRVLIRRGDPLGLRGAADYFGVLLAPGLSNATVDARWISLLSWCLKWSHVAWRNAGGRDVAQGDTARMRYAWLRPLELMWVDRTLESGQTSGQMRGRRSIERWRKAGRTPENFAMAPDTFHGYRQTGMYGAYRVVFRKVPGLTMGGDGWTLADTGVSLANLVNESLPAMARLTQDRFEKGIRWGAWVDKEARYWVQQGWRHALHEPQHGWLPTSASASMQLLPVRERRLLEKALFAPQSLRRLTAEALADAPTARSHAELCDWLAQSPALLNIHNPAVLQGLPAFTRFADASMDVMRELWYAMNRDESQQAPRIDKLARSAHLRSLLELMRQTAATWLATPCAAQFQFGDVATQLAQAMYAAATPLSQLRALAHHHAVYGGGRRWFREQSGTLEPLVAETGIFASDYRFRLGPLIKLAVQCGVADMQGALEGMAGHELADEEAEPDEVVS